MRIFLVVLLSFAWVSCDQEESNLPVSTALSDTSTTADPVTRAKKLLTEAGYPNGKGFPKLEILYNTSESHQKIASAIQNMWRTNLGIEVELRNSEWKVYLDDLTKLRYQIARRGWIGDYPDPFTFIELFSSWSGNNNTGWVNKEYDALLKAGSNEADAPKRLDILRKAEEILMAELPILPLYSYVTKNMWKDHVKGLYHNYLDVHPFNEVYAEGRDLLVINNATEVQSLDPTLTRGQPEHRITLALFEGLLNYHPQTLEPKPGVAERWEVSKDGLTYTFYLRDCRWSDGKPVTAHDFVYAWTRALHPETPTDYAHILYFVKNAEAFNQKKISDPSQIGMRAKDDRTLVVALEHPCPFFPYLACFFTYSPIRKDLIEKYGDAWVKPENFVGNGPFVLKEWKPTDYILVEKSPTYWNAGKVRQKRIKFLPIEKAMTAFNMYEKGQCDFLTDLPLEIIDDLKKRSDYHCDTFFATYYYSFNITRPPLNDVRVRKALALAIDRDVIVNKITRQGQQAAFSITPPVFGNYTAPRFDAP